MQILLSIIIISSSFLIGVLPLINWINYIFTGKNLKEVGTGNISVSAAFTQSGTKIGILAVLSEAIKGIVVVLLAREIFPETAVWQIIAIIALVIGRYSFSRGAGTTNAFWGIITYDAIAALISLGLTTIIFSLWRQRQIVKYLALVIISTVIAIRHWRQPSIVISTIGLSCLLAGIYQTIPDDLAIKPEQNNKASSTMFRFLRGKSPIIPLTKPNNPKQVGGKAANLSKLHNWGYPVPKGWIILPETDPADVREYLPASIEYPLVVRSSAIGEDSELSSAAGQYTTILNVTSFETLIQAIEDCRQAYNNPGAKKYRQDRQQVEGKMAVIVQKQISGQLSGVAFSRDPLTPSAPEVLIEAVEGNANQVVSGKITPKSYRVTPKATEFNPESETIIQKVGEIAREIEGKFQGIPQDIEWTYDGQTLWLLQTRPITNLQPLWTRKIAAEVIPGLIKPLTWSINRPLTCGVWGEIFTIVLGNRATGLDFTATATLHQGFAYFNATLLGDIFLRMGLPPESLEFLTRGAKMSKPPLISTLSNIPGLWRLLQREISLVKDWGKDNQEIFQPNLTILAENNFERSPQVIITRIERILELLETATYYSILAPLSLAIRKAILKVDDNHLDNTVTPEVTSMVSLSKLAAKTAKLLPPQTSKEELWQQLQQTDTGREILREFQELLSSFQYLSEAATNIAIPRWGDNPEMVKDIFFGFFNNPLPEKSSNKIKQNLTTKIVQKRLTLKGEVTTVYSQLLAYLRWSFLDLATLWEASGLLVSKTDIFWLTYPEIKQVVAGEMAENLSLIIEKRQSDWQAFKTITNPPYLVYGDNPDMTNTLDNAINTQGKLIGIGASVGEKIGLIKIIQNFSNQEEINSENILVVPYTDSGWSPFLVRAGGIISEVGGRLSHGAIIAREYGIPAIMDVQNATSLLKDGQRVRINGYSGVIEILDE